MLAPERVKVSPEPAMVTRVAPPAASAIGAEMVAAAAFNVILKVVEFGVMVLAGVHELVLLALENAQLRTSKLARAVGHHSS